MVPALSSRGQSSAFGKSHLNTFSLVPELNLLQKQHITHHQSLVTVVKYQFSPLRTVIYCVPEQGEVGGSLREAVVVVLQAVVLLQKNGHGA